MSLGYVRYREHPLLHLFHQSDNSQEIESWSYGVRTYGHAPPPTVQKAGQTPQPHGAWLRSRTNKPVLYCAWLDIRTLHSR